MVGATKVYEPPMTAGRRVPRKLWSSVLMPATNSSVWITRAFSSCRARERSELSCQAPAVQQRRQHNETRRERERGRGTYIAAAHLGDERGWDDDGGAEHDEVVLEAQEDGLRCTAT
jgi:hypothetical protein